MRRRPARTGALQCRAPVDPGPPRRRDWAAWFAHRNLIRTRSKYEGPAELVSMLRPSPSGFGAIGARREREREWRRQQLARFNSGGAEASQLSVFGAKLGDITSYLYYETFMVCRSWGASLTARPQCVQCGVDY